MSQEHEVLLRTEALQEHFTVKKARGKKARVYAVDSVDLTIYKGETFGLVGESGCGKSTLGKVILGLYPPTGGKVWFEGKDVSALKGKARQEFTCHAQMIFQDPSSCLNPRRRIRDILLEPYIIHNLYDAAERLRRVEELCDLVGLSHAYLERYPHEMSGGQKQRVGIARALALKPELIVCDEPVSALDVSIQAQVLNLLEDVQQKLGLTYLFISHNLSVVEHICQRIGVMYLGRIVELADAATLYQTPLHPYTQALISAVPVIDDGTGAPRRQRIVLTGDLPSPANPPSGCRFHTRCPFAREICSREVPPFLEREPGHFVACHLCENNKA